MKSISFASGTLITGSAVAVALLDYVSQMSSANNSATVEIPVLESNGTITTHTIVVSSSIQFDVADADGASNPFDEDERFPVPEFPPLDTMVAVIPPASAAEDSTNFDKAVADLDAMLDQPEA
jgi:hypothetical protein